MSIAIRLKGVKTNNPALPINDISQHPAQAGLVCEYDFLTFMGDGVTMVDKSGNANHAVFNGTPRTDLQGVIFDGTRYADTGKTNLGFSMSGFVVVRIEDLAVSGAGGHILSNWGALTGAFMSVYGPPSESGFKFAAQLGATGGQQAKDAAIAVAGRWELRYFYVNINGGMTVKSLGTGTMATPFASGTGNDARSWLIGAARSASNGGVVDMDFALRNAKLAYGGLYNKVLDTYGERYLLDYVRTKMAFRSIAV